MDLTGSHVLVIGGSGTLGSAVAAAAAAAGARVTVTATTQDSADTVAGRLGVSGVACDVSEHGALPELAERLDDVNHVVVTAARMTFDGLLDADGAALSALVDTKLWGGFHVGRAFGRVLGEGDSLTFTSGMLSRAPSGAAPLAAVNGAIESLGRALAVELAPVRVNVVSPGALGSPGVLTHDGTAADAAAVYLAAMTNPWMTGSVLDVHGGAVHPA